VSNVYATVQDAITRNSSLADIDVGELDTALDAASRGIDGYCGRRFWLDPVATIRVFSACDWYELDLGPHEIGVSTGVTIATDDGTGTFATTVAASGYQLEPINAPYEPTGAAPYTSVRRLGGSWPKAYTTSGRRDLVRITARYGWPSVPTAVREACLALTSYQLENPTGVRAEAIDGYSVSYGASRDVGSAIESNPAIRSKLNPYRRGWAV
jgi:hypothetical protein